MASQSGKQKVYDALRGQVLARLTRAMDIAEADLANLRSPRTYQYAIFDAW
jgi:hypothetical protein